MWITIREYAKKEGISVQSVYERRDRKKIKVEEREREVKKVERVMCVWVEGEEEVVEEKEEKVEKIEKAEKIEEAEERDDTGLTKKEKKEAHVMMGAADTVGMGEEEVAALKLELDERFNKRYSDMGWIRHEDREDSDHDHWIWHNRFFGMKTNSKGGGKWINDEMKEYLSFFTDEEVWEQFQWEDMNNER